MAATITKNEKLVEVKNEGDEQNEVSKSEAEAKEGVQKKRGRKPNNGNIGTATISQEKNIKRRGRPKKSVTTKEEMMMRIGVVKSNDDGKKSPEETEEGMIDAESALATPDGEGNGTNEALNNKEGTIENERPASKSTTKDGLKSKLHANNKVPDENGNLTKVDSNMCHQCHSIHKGRVVRCQQCNTRRYCLPCMKKWYKCSTKFLPIQLSN